jgi:hypothetical protein
MVLNNTANFTSLRMSSGFSYKQLTQGGRRRGSTGEAIQLPR